MAPIKFTFSYFLALQVFSSIVAVSRSSEVPSPILKISDDGLGKNVNDQSVTSQYRTQNTHSRLGRVANANLNFDVANFISEVEDWVNKTDGRERKDFVKGLLEKAKFQAPEGYSVMVFNMGQKYDENLRDVLVFLTVEKDGITWGIWVFKCGTFISKGDRDWQNWGYYGQFYNFALGYGVIFVHPDCDMRPYRPLNHYVIHNKDYRQPDVRKFNNVDSIEECAAWTTEIDQNVAVYRKDTKECHVKEIHDGRGVTHDKWGNRLGDYDIYFQDIAVSRDSTKRQEWISSGKCDLMHTSNEGQHFCKVFERSDGSTLLFRHRD